MSVSIDYSQKMKHFLNVNVKLKEFPSITGTKSGRLIIVGCSRNVWEDIESYNKYMNHVAKDHFSMPGDVMCINDMICYYPGLIHHAYTNNEKRLDTYWKSRRIHYKDRFKSKKNGEHIKPYMHTLTLWDEPHIRWPFRGTGTSSLNACYVAIAMGYDDIALCGLPMDGSGHFWEYPGERPPKGRRPDEQFWNNIHLWQEARDYVFEGKIKSMSGNTRDFLGSPDGKYIVLDKYA